jgi:hypothetical protein
LFTPQTTINFYDGSILLSPAFGPVIAVRDDKQNCLAELFFSLSREGIGATVRDFLKSRVL